MFSKRRPHTGIIGNFWPACIYWRKLNCSDRSSAHATIISSIHECWYIIVQSCSSLNVYYVTSLWLDFTIDPPPNIVPYFSKARTASKCGGVMIDYNFPVCYTQRSILTVLYVGCYQTVTRNSNNISGYVDNREFITQPTLMSHSPAKFKFWIWRLDSFLKLMFLVVLSNIF